MLSFDNYAPAKMTAFIYFGEGKIEVKADLAQP